MRRKAAVDTRTRLLDVAERLLASRGLEACSVRDIVRAARANLGAVTYHFGSKNRLIQAVLQRRLEPLNRERLSRLEDAEARSEGGSPALERVLEAALAPTIRLLRDNPDFMRIVGEVLTSPDRAIVKPPEVQAMLERFMKAIARAVPGIPPKELAWRMHFLRGALIHTWTASRILCEMTHDESALRHPETILARLVRFGAAGLRAPVPGRRSAGPRKTSRRSSR